MSLADEFNQISTIFIDTAPIIYYVEAHPRFGLLAKEVVDSFQSGRLSAFSSVITLAEVLPKPIEAGDEKLAKKFGRLRGKYSDLRSMDAIQLSVAIDVGVDAFLTNDKTLAKLKEINVLILKDYL